MLFWKSERWKYVSIFIETITISRAIELNFKIPYCPLEIPVEKVAKSSFDSKNNQSDYGIYLHKNLNL